MATCNPQALLDSANCFDCLSDLQLEQVQVQMLCDLVNAGLAGGPFVRISGDTMTGSLGIGFSHLLAPVNGLIVSGNSGFGLSNPMNALEVAGSMVVGAGYAGGGVSPNNGILIEGNSAIGYNSPLVRFVVGTSLGLREFDSEVGANYMESFNSNRTSKFGFSNYATFHTFNTSSGGGYTETLRAASTGRVGIRTSSPQSTCDIVGNLTIGATYGGVNAAPTSGAIIEGPVGIGTNAPDADAILDLVSTTKAFLPPRMTEVQRDAIPTPTAGMVVYNSTTNLLNFYNGAAWGAV